MLKVVEVIAVAVALQHIPLSLHNSAAQLTGKKLQTMLSRLESVVGCVVVKFVVDRVEVVEVFIAVDVVVFVGVVVLVVELTVVVLALIVVAVTPGSMQQSASLSAFGWKSTQLL